MAELKMFDQTVGLLQKVLDLRLKNQQVITSNIANADTPGYVPAHFRFEKDLQRALSTPQAPQAGEQPGEIPVGGGRVAAVQGEVVRDPVNSSVGDGNGVRVDQQMIDLSENQIMYEAATEMLNHKFGLLKYVVDETK